MPVIKKGDVKQIVHYYEHAGFFHRTSTASAALMLSLKAFSPAEDIPGEAPDLSKSIEQRDLSILLVAHHYLNDKNNEHRRLYKMLQQIQALIKEIVDAHLKLRNRNEELRRNLQACKIDLPLHFKKSKVPTDYFTKAQKLLTQYEEHSWSWFRSSISAQTMADVKQALEKRDLTRLANVLSNYFQIDPLNERRRFGTTFKNFAQEIKEVLASNEALQQENQVLEAMSNGSYFYTDIRKSLSAETVDLSNFISSLYQLRKVVNAECKSADDYHEAFSKVCVTQGKIKISLDQLETLKKLVAHLNHYMQVEAKGVDPSREDRSVKATTLLGDIANLMTHGLEYPPDFDPTPNNITKFLQASVNGDYPYDAGVTEQFDRSMQVTASKVKEGAQHVTKLGDWTPKFVDLNEGDDSEEDVFRPTT